MKILSISEASLFLGISKTTLRRWDSSGYLKPKYRTKGNHRKYDISDLGSGINFHKKGLKELIKLILNSEIETIYLTHKDRLLRFGTELIISICEEFNTKIKFLDEKEESFEEKLSKDVIEILTVFSSRLYGKRSHKNKNILLNSQQISTNIDTQRN